MAKKKQSSKVSPGKKSFSGARKKKVPFRPQRSAAYEAALRDYGEALELLRKGDYQKAIDRFKQIEAGSTEEPELAERARTYTVVCARKLAPVSTEPRTTEERYHRAVVLTNDRQLDEAIRLLDQALKDEPSNATVLYARASARALQGNTEAVVADLRQAISIDSAVRYQAINDPDFEKVRDDAAFIDIIEPTTSGA